MPARASKPDDVQNALRVARGAAGQTPKTEPVKAPGPESAASAAARTLGALGASPGGVARAEALSKKKRTEIARRAVPALWSKKPGKGVTP